MLNGFCCNELYLDLWKYSQGLKISFGSTLTGLQIGLKVIPVVEESLIGLIEAVSWLGFCSNKLY